MLWIIGPLFAMLHPEIASYPHDTQKGPLCTSI